ncbi:MAG: exodeoxyribonuclease I [Methylomonas sp.]|nr:exodeoxyribonuclease I [Methylomonas sp.]PPD22824.1 MAG: exodeoxyribonuclease I [Methylomonas sp.]PPD25428.1 MAG: exodeoxyribonuclease I [Methylomonas sp.]PPD36075.1 MAG: exodeoxyribonuclease I [Methylomonas sp.]PPD42739.1 MAG: exodeoxyribonuclease I [Methylomonas sp.]
MTTLFWHDYETFGADPQRDRPCQFAGLRTDLDFNIVEDPLMLYCKPAEDYLPHPEACLITGITPQHALANGVCEAEFAALVHQALAQPGTCALGYNSLRFDDEVSRHLFYRNFFDPYAREWQNGNSRWDLIDVVRATEALRPDGITWPQRDDGAPSFRLEALTAANGISHDTAHDALSDVHATIALARLVKTRQPRLFDYLFEHRSKQKALTLLGVGSGQPLIHVSGRYPARQHHLAVVLPLAVHSERATEIIVYDLSADPTALIELNADAIRTRLFTAADDLPEGVERIALKTIHVNRCPVLAPLPVMRPHDAERLSIDLEQCQRHAHQLQAAAPLTAKLADVFRRENLPASADPDLMLYSGGFFSTRDKTTLAKIRNLSPRQLADNRFRFDDARLPEMLFRYRARNYPDSLHPDEAVRWQQVCHARLSDPQAPIDLSRLQQTLQRLHGEDTVDPAILDALSAFAAEKRERYQ